MPKIAVIGGSGTSTPRFVETVQRVLGTHAQARGPVQVVLIGRNREKLEAVARICRTLAPAVDTTADDSLARGVEGASVILNQIRVGGLEGRAWDEQAPTQVGLLGEETMGAGGFALGYRTLPVIRSMARVIEQHAPQAWFVNLTNPANLVVATLAAETRIRALSICDIPVTLERTLRTVADDTLADTSVFGTNHVSAIISARDAAGHELLPQLLSRLASQSAYTGPFDAATLTAFGFFPSPYLRFVWYPEEYTPTHPVQHSRADELLALQDELLATYSATDTEHATEQARVVLAKRNPHWYDEVVVPVMAALLQSPQMPAQRFVLQIPNRGLVPFVGDHAAVETSVVIADGVITPLAVPAVPPEIKTLTMQLTEADELIRLATLENNPDLAIRALALNPLVPSMTKARAFWRLFATRWLDHE